MTQQIRQRGFTLVEVLVALGIVSIALLAGLQASSALTRNAQRQTDALLAQLCAENELVKVRLSRQLPGVGENAFSCIQAGRTFDGRLIVATTPNPSFLRVDAQVFDGEFSLLRISTVVGRF
ncbi:MAG: type II secretion system minor pseudopilin GspI [Pseudomonadota bacterium]